MRREVRQSFGTAAWRSSSPAPVESGEAPNVLLGHPGVRLPPTKALLLPLARELDPPADIGREFPIIERPQRFGLDLAQDVKAVEEGCRETPEEPEIKPMLGDLAAAIALLEESRALTNPQKDRPLFYSIRHNLTVFLANAGRYTEAEALLPEVRRLAEQGGLALDCLRLQWVEGKIAAGRGKVTQAIEILTKVRGGFQSQRIWYDAALVSLEISTFHLRAGRTVEVKTIARHLVPIFQGEGVHREALAALLVFRQAAEKDAVTLDLIDRVHGFLIAVRRNPKLTWTSD
jgi:hypothetical protein